MKTLYVFLIGLLVISMLVTGCGAKSTVAPEAPTEVKIGIVLPLTGALAPTGLEVKNAMELAIEIINNEYPDLDIPLAKTKGLPGLSGARVVGIFADHEFVPEKAMSETERLITQEKVVAMVGAFASSCTATASQAAERLGIPFLNDISTAVRLHSQGFKWFFQTCPDDDDFSEAMFLFLKDMNEEKGTKIETVATIYENTLFGTSSSESENRMAEKYGFQVVANIAYPAKTTDLSSEVQALKAANANVVIPSSYIADALLLTRTRKGLDFNPQAILAQGAGHTEADFLKTVGPDGDYILSREVFALDLAQKNPIVTQINDMYKQRHGSDLNGGIARAFTGILVLAEAINRAGSTEPEAIRQALLATDIPPEQLIMPWDGVKFDPENGKNMLAKGIIVQAVEGKFWTVWPFDLAAREVIWPTPKWSER